MNDTQITKLLTRRNRLLTRRDGLYDHAIIDRIDRQLAEVPAGVNNEIDLALGRACAKLPKRCTIRDGWPTPAQNAATVAEAMPEAARMAEAMCAQAAPFVARADLDAEMRQRCADYEIEPPEYDGMWK